MAQGGLALCTSSLTILQLPPPAVGKPGPFAEFTDEQLEASIRSLKCEIDDFEYRIEELTLEKEPLEEELCDLQDELERREDAAD